VKCYEEEDAEDDDDDNDDDEFTEGEGLEDEGGRWKTGALYEGFWKALAEVAVRRGGVANRVRATEGDAGVARVAEIGRGGYSTEWSLIKGFEEEGAARAEAGEEITVRTR